MSMRALYHFTFLPPEMPECVAEWQEVRTLSRHFGGDWVYLNPNHRSLVYVPRLLFGFHKLRALRQREAHLSLHHVYNPDPFPFPVLKFLRRPVVYSVSGGAGSRSPNRRFFDSLAAVVVSDARSLARFRQGGLHNVFLVRAGVDTSRFGFSPLPLGSEVTLMVGSAPWTLAQFRTKGVEALLVAARRNPKLRLVFLWRGALAEEMAQRVEQMDLTQQVAVLNERVDVNQVLAGVHASITLSAAPGIVKAFPHSLIESLAAGKPVLISQAIPMADYARESGCGVVVEEVTPEHVLAAVEELLTGYSSFQAAALQAGRSDFTQQGMLDSFGRVYEKVLKL